MKTARNMLGLFLVLTFALASGEAWGQSYPSKPVHFVVPYAPGGQDVIARIVGQLLGERLGKPIVIENKPGADAVIGMDYVAKSAPDGYTLLVGGASMIYNYSLFDRLPFDTLKDLVPITVIANSALVVAVHPSVPVTSMKELIVLARANPGQLFYGSGTTSFKVAMEFFKKRAGVDIVSVPYKGSGPTVTAAIAGEVPVLVASNVSVLGTLRAGKLRALAVTGSKRSAFLPDVPTMMESGVEFEGDTWTGLFAPAGTPRAIMDKLYSELSVVLKYGSLKERYAAVGYETIGIGMTPAEFEASFRSSIEQWSKVIKELHITR